MYIIKYLNLYFKIYIPTKIQILHTPKLPQKMDMTMFFHNTGTLKNNKIFCFLILWKAINNSTD